MTLHFNQSPQNIVMANSRNVFMTFVVLSCAGDVLTGLPDIQKNPEGMMLGANVFETIEKRVAETVDKRVAEMVDKRVAEMVETRVVEIVEARVADAVETRVVQEMSKLKDEIKSELAFDMTEECTKINEGNGKNVNRNENFDKIIREDLRQNLKDELMTELNATISSVVPRALRDLPYLVTCAYKVYNFQEVQGPQLLLVWACLNSSFVPLALRPCGHAKMAILILSFLAGIQNAAEIFFL